MLNNDIKEYEFTNFTEVSQEKDTIKGFEFQEINKETPAQIESKQLGIKIERKYAQESNFAISPIVKQHRGINDQEEEERERRINDEVEIRLDKFRQAAYEKGHQEGLEAAREEVFNQSRQASEEKLELLTSMISEVLETKAELLKQEKLSVQKTVKSLVKWIILRELKDDGKYVERLLQKLIEEMGCKSNILIQVNQKNFDDMPEILETIQNKIGTLKNVRLEVDYDMEEEGITLNTQNGIIDGKLSEQFKTLDKLFFHVGLEEVEDFDLDECKNEKSINDLLDENKSEIVPINTLVEEATTENDLENRDLQSSKDQESPDDES